jgi:hypothetical protein
MEIKSMVVKIMRNKKKSRVRKIQNKIMREKKNKE